MKNEKNIRKKMSPAERPLADSLRYALEGNGLEDRTWELTLFCCFPVEESIGHFIPCTEWVKVLINLFAIPKLIKAGIKTIRKIEKKHALELIRDGINPSLHTAYANLMQYGGSVS